MKRFGSCLRSGNVRRVPHTANIDFVVLADRASHRINTGWMDNVAARWRILTQGRKVSPFTAQRRTGFVKFFRGYIIAIDSEFAQLASLVPELVVNPRRPTLPLSRPRLRGTLAGGVQGRSGWRTSEILGFRTEQPLGRTKSS